MSSDDAAAAAADERRKAANREYQRKARAAGNTAQQLQRAARAAETAALLTALRNPPVPRWEAELAAAATAPYDDSYLNGVYHDRSSTENVWEWTAVRAMRGDAGNRQSIEFLLAWQPTGERRWRDSWVRAEVQEEAWLAVIWDWLYNRGQGSEPGWEQWGCVIEREWRGSR